MLSWAVFGAISKGKQVDIPKGQRWLYTAPNILVKKSIPFGRSSYPKATVVDGQNLPTLLDTLYVLVKNMFEL